ncbi:MAG: acetyltransferase [Desulforhopalus sp.]
MYIDIFNGDADGIFATHQYRLANPQAEAKLVTGVKRDIHLLSRMEDVDHHILTVFDISLDSNRSSLIKILANGNTVRYFDHHYAVDIPDSVSLETHIEPSPDTCTSIIVNDALGGKYCLWAICGAFGDNIHHSARRLAKTENLSNNQIEKLRELGELFNYNGYGTTTADLHFHPRDLYLAVHPYPDPLVFIEESAQLEELRSGYHEDLALAMQQKSLDIGGNIRVYSLPDKPWARRVTGVFSNLKARELPAFAHGVITENSDGTLRISVRAPLEDRRDADTLCKLFPTGGGRAAAAGINSLPAEQLELFFEKFQTLFP